MKHNYWHTRFTPKISLIVVHHLITTLFEITYLTSKYNWTISLTSIEHTRLYVLYFIVEVQPGCNNGTLYMHA